MLRSTIRMRIPIEKQREALEILRSLTEEISFEPGCIGCRLYRDMEDERAIMLEELWQSFDDMLRHLRLKKYRKVLLVIEMSEEPPEIRFDKIAESSGVEIIEKARDLISE